MIYSRTRTTMLNLSYENVHYVLSILELEVLIDDPGINLSRLHNILHN
jgi:hypothetical protein